MDTLRISCITWNVETSWPEEDLHSLLGLSEQKEATHTPLLPDLYLICLQEVRSQPQNVIMDTLFEEPWTTAFREVLGSLGYIRMTGERLQGTVTSIFVLRHHLPYFRDIYTAVTRTGLGGLWGNKGGVSVRFSLYGCSLCIVNSHLAAHDSGYEERCMNYNSIIDETVFPIQPTSNILFHDYVIWLGDLNYRLTGEDTAELISKKVASKNFEWLLGRDELKKAQLTGDAFGPLTEGKITFPPTYKYKSLVHYDLSRRPAWTDRILYQVHEEVYENTRLGVEQITYESKQEYSQSDHKPVVSTFVIRVFAHHFERCVTFRPIKEWLIGGINQITYSMDNDVEISPWDYIAVFKANFTSVHQYVTYAYVSQSTPRAQLPSETFLSKEDNETKPGRIPSTRSFQMTVSDELVQSAGLYVLLYYSAKYICYLGMSSPFPVVEKGA